MKPCLDIAVYRKLDDRARTAYLARILPVTEEVAELIVEYTFLDGGRLGLLLADRAPRPHAESGRAQRKDTWLGRPDDATRIVEAAARLCCVTAKALESPQRDSEVSRARSIACAGLRRAGYSTPAAARFLGGLNHTSVLTASKRGEERWPKLVDEAMREAATDAR